MFDHGTSVLPFTLKCSCDLLVRSTCPTYQVPIQARRLTLSMQWRQGHPRQQWPWGSSRRTKGCSVAICCADNPGHTLFSGERTCDLHWSSRPERGHVQQPHSGYASGCCSAARSIPFTSSLLMCRFPLRTEELARASSISKQAYTIEKIQALLAQLAVEAQGILLFLKTVARVEVG